MSLPFRFKAGVSGGPDKMSTPGVVAHHHRSTTKADHKAFKSRFKTKSALKDQAKGKIESRNERTGNRRTPHQQVMSKLARRNQAKQIRTHQREKQDHESQMFQGQDGAPKHVAIVPLSSEVSTEDVIQQLSDSIDLSANLSENGLARVRVDRFRRNLLFMPTTTDIISALDVCRLADWVLIILTPEQTYGFEEDTLLKALEGQGITNVTAIVQGLDSGFAPPKRSRQLVELKMGIGRYFPALDKILSLDSKADGANLMRSLCTATTKGIRWRDDRSWMLIDDVVWQDSASEASTVTLLGTVRGRGLNPDRLVHVPGWGDYRISNITQVASGIHKRKADEMQVEEPVRTWQPTPDRDDLAELAPESVDMVDATSTTMTTEHKGVLLDDHHYFSDDNSHIPDVPKKLPKGTSSYQAAWFLEDVSDSESDVDEENDADVLMQADDNLGPEDGIVSDGVDGLTDAAGREYPESEMHIEVNDEEEARQLEQFRASRKNEAQEDLEFPDEIELHPDVLARERLAKYRGLKSLRTSEWNQVEDEPYEPLEHKRLLQIFDYKKSSNSALKEALHDGVPPGTKVQVKLEGVPEKFRGQTLPTSLFSLLRHEHKHAVINLNLTLHSGSVDHPVRSKEELIVQIGHRRLVIQPLFSAAGQTPNDVHKFDRYLHPGHTAIASFVGPITWGSVPVLVFKRVDDAKDEAPTLLNAMSDESPKLQEHLKLIGSATTIPSSPTRVIAKRVILTGHPFKIHKKLVTIRYMFFNREDVAWFAALPLWTKRGRQGFIKEPLGTHGYFKATFDGKINPLDAIGVSLYKRMFPRPARALEM